ncbi:outer membrane protein assembly factor BamB family protein [Tuwongella immobilis]|uniref:Pyrrolo-quinoline quinone repeat domain-containing protein n=1 Tax=Tuwongella immobilis TaxID=692036 RepID=A0A6C2YPK3_9BACT|nr:PQQ-binding-like beta-propeller repeat protein [Tuwongella immobilis]VIP03287.1 Uncharacterized protein OS=Planctomyces maris DSM 8797 GN=PM8797T_24141 PE=4 SV=1: PQQ_2 [Tuwongella immobilis]VTS03946.1 Uncharacterized protein OS=Planctomyces maris DSM 8797 GN=PM8797T_24141 PE=4 SV=1: PQQ_2 [Tuwongella immobilis]
MRSLLGFCLMLAPATLLAADWNQFRGPEGNGVSAEKNLPESWSQSKNVAWVADLPGDGVSSPVVWGDRVFITSNSGIKRDRLIVSCYSLKDGKQLWSRQIWATGATGCHPMTAMAAPTPAVDANGVYALFATGDLVAFSLTGELKWTRALANDYPAIANQVGMASSPILWEGSLIVPMDNTGDSFLSAVDTRYGQNIWKVKRPRETNWVTPVLRTSEGVTEVVFASGDGVVGYDISSGKERWKFKGEGVGSIPSPLVAAGVLIVPANGVVAVDAKAGQEPKTLWKAPQLRSNMSSPLVYGNFVYSINSTGVLICASLADGKILWQERLKGKFHATPVAADGKIYAVNEDGVTYVVEPGEKAEVLATNDLKDAILATPAIAEGTILLRSRNKLYAIGKTK